MRIFDFKGGERLQTKLDEILKKTTGQHEVKVGFLSGSTYPDGTPVAEVAAIHNFGAPAANIPARPFFSNMVAEEKPKWGAAIARLLKENGYDAGKALALMGEDIGGALQQSIVDTNSPDLADATIERKGFDKPLIDTGHMRNSVGYQVDNGEKVIGE